MASQATKIHAKAVDPTFRKGMICAYCKVARNFVYVAPYWSCVVCGTEDLSDDGYPAPSPWVPRDSDNDDWRECWNR